MELTTLLITAIIIVNNHINDVILIKNNSNLEIIFSSQLNNTK